MKIHVTLKVLCSMVFFFGHLAYADTLTTKFGNANDVSQAAKGKVLYESVCASCHNKDLSGSTGFNLKDGEWIHGEQADQILNNIKQGFPKAGMPAFDSVFSEMQLKQIVAYIQSMREGWQNLEYKIYDLSDEASRDWSVILQKKPNKQSKVFNNIADFAMPESYEYAIVFSGDFYAPRTFDSQLFTKVKETLIQVYVDGQPVERTQDGWNNSWPLKRGKQKLEFRLMTPKSRPEKLKTDLSLIVKNKAGTIKIFAASAKGVLELQGTHYPIVVSDTTKVQRKPIVDLPAYSIAVGLPEKINYTFNTKTCGVNGIWTGDLLNIGPNIKGRGQDASVPLGNWLFKPPVAISASERECTYLQYVRDTQTSFEFKVDDIHFSLTGKMLTDDFISFKYELISNPSKVQTINFDFPVDEFSLWQQQGGRFVNSGTDKMQWQLDLTKHKFFSLQLATKGN